MRTRPLTVGSSCPDSVIELARSLRHRVVYPLAANSSLLIATTVQDSSYRSAISLGIPVVSPSILASGREFDDDVIHEHSLPLFAGLQVYVEASLRDEQQRQEDLLQSNGAGIVDERNTADIIVSSSKKGIKARNGQIVVTPQWIYESQDLGWCANETNFALERGLKRRSARKYGRTTKKCLDQRTTCTAEEGPTVSDCASPMAPILSMTTKNDKQKYKRYQLAMELFECEINALKIVDFLVRASADVDCLSGREVDVIFSTFRGLHPVNTKIVSLLGDAIGAWNDTSTIGDIYTTEAGGLSSACLPYFHSLEHSLRVYKRCFKENARFASFVESREKDRSIGRQKIEHLISVPYQQIMSRTTILLKEIHKNTDEKHVDSELLLRSIEVVEEILSKANDNRKQSAVVDEMFSQIEDLPAFFFHEPRTMIGRFPLIAQGGTGGWGARGPCMLLLFQDVVLVVLELEAEGNCVQIRSKNGESFRYVQYCPYEAVREVVHIENGDSSLYFVTIRTDLSDDEWRLFDGGKDTIDALQLLISQVRMRTARCIYIAHVPFARAGMERQSALSAVSSPASTDASPLSRTLKTLSLRVRRMTRRGASASSLTSTPSRSARVPSLALVGRTPSSVSSSQASSQTASSSHSSSTAASWSLNENDPRLTVPVEPYEVVKRFTPIINPTKRLSHLNA